VRGAAGGHSLEFVADIVAPSDDGISKNNPADFFFREFSRIARKECGYAGGFEIRIGDHFTGRYPDRRRRLLLPAKGQLSAFLALEFKPFFSNIRDNPTTTHSHRCCEPGVDISVKFDPSKKDHNAGQYGLCSVPYSLENNRLFYELDIKARQLRRSGFEGPKGIIVADGGCQALVANSGSGGDPWSRDEIIEHFLRKHRYVDFVTLTTCETELRNHVEYRLRHRIYWKRPFEDQKIRILHPVLGSALCSLPRPRRDPRNAWLRLREGRDIAAGWSLGASVWTPNRRLKYSARTFLALTAGTLSETQLRLSLNERMPNRAPFFEFFRRIFELNHEIRAVGILRKPDEDDDEIVFNLRPDQNMPYLGSGGESARSIEIPVAGLVRFFAQLAYELLSPGTKRFSLGQMAPSIKLALQEGILEGRMLTDAGLEQGGRVLRLRLGSRDAAVSEYR
jgi:hypothetical protein